MKTTVSLSVAIDADCTNLERVLQEWEASVVGDVWYGVKGDTGACRRHNLLLEIPDQLLPLLPDILREYRLHAQIAA